MRIPWAIIVVCSTALNAYAEEAPAFLKELGVLSWHQKGFKGQGTKILVLDTGFRGFKEYLGRALPKKVQVRSFRTDGNLEARPSQHGICCAEIIARIAPEAEILLADWEPDQPESFLDAVRWGREQQVDIISCSVVIPGWGTGSGNGPVHQALAKILGAGQSLDDPLMIAAAGNLALRHWSGNFSGQSAEHEWVRGKTANRLETWPDQPLNLDLTWTSNSKYRVLLLDEQGQEIPRVRTFKNAAGGITARLPAGPSRTIALRVEHKEGVREEIALTVLGANLQYRTSGKSIPFPADNSRVLAVGAVDVSDERCLYSGCGSLLSKPDLVARVPLLTRVRTAPFDGTSASAPQVAGLAALIRSRHRDWSAQETSKILIQQAIDLGTPGHDAETGWGRAKLPAE